MAHIGRIQGATRVLGKSQGYYGLPVLDSVQQLDDLPQMLQTMGFDPVSGACPVYQTVWFPDPDELARLNAGAGIHVTIVGIAVQPMKVEIGEPPEPVEPAETYYTKGKTGEWFETVDDHAFATALTHAAQDLNDTGLGDPLDRWMPINIMLSEAANRIERLLKK